jgi:CRP/FNR family nitrogen fixation transcriptional regulator
MASPGSACVGSDHGCSSVLEALRDIAVVSSYDAGDTVYYEQIESRYYYGIVRGAARKVIVLSEGRRSIVEFLMPGDLFGFGSSFERLYSVEVIAARTAIARYACPQIEELANRDPLVARCIRSNVLESLARSQWRAVLRGAKALEKVSAFLMEMAERSGWETRDEVVLPMSRYDVADYLGVAVETVSRALAQLQHRGVISLRSPRHIRVVSWAALSRLPFGSEKPAGASVPAAQARKAPLRGGRITL